MNSKQRYFFNIFFLMVAVLWPLFKSLYLGGIDGAGRVEMLLMLITVGVNGMQLFRVPRVMHVWLLWIVYCAINMHYQGFYSETNTYSNWVVNRLIFPYVCMLVSYQAFAREFTESSSRLFYYYLVYVVLGFWAMNTVEAHDIGMRMTNDMGNTFFNTSVLLAFFASLMYGTKKINGVSYWIVLCLVSIVILLSGERKGFIALFIIIVGSLYGANMKMNRSSLLRMAMVAGLAFLLLNVALNYFTFGQRMTNSMENSEFTDNLFLRLMGDRGSMYFEGWALFLQNPWFGIGLHRYALYNSYVANLVFHTEYMVQLCECGIVGASMFAVFYWGMIKRLFRLWKDSLIRSITATIAATLLAIISINFVAWTYDNPNYFMVYGLIYAYFDYCKKTKSLSKT